MITIHLLITLFLLVVFSAIITRLFKWFFNKPPKPSDRIYQGKLMALAFALLAAILALLGSVSLGDYIPETLSLLSPALAGGTVYLLFVYMLERGVSKKTDNRLVAKIFSLVFAAALITCVYTATQSLWISPWDPNINRSVYENIATTTGFASIFLVFVLSALQKDLYWVSRKNTVKFDERELKDRQEVFELSYIIGALLVFGGVLFFMNTAHNIPSIAMFNDIPGHLYWLPGSLAIMMFALPLVVAAWKKH